MEINLPIICVDNSNRPNEIPINKWLIKDHKYTAIKLIKNIDGKQGFKLKELNIDDCVPFTNFSINRFMIDSDKIDEIKNIAVEIISEKIA